MSSDGTYNVRHSRAEPSLRALVTVRPDIATSIDRAGDRVTIEGRADAGSGLGFLLDVWVGLQTGHPVDLRGVQMLDGHSKIAFNVMMDAYWRGDGEL